MARWRLPLVGAAVVALLGGVAVAALPADAAVTIRVAPYVDMGSWPTPALSTLSKASGVKSYTLGFVTGAGCKASCDRRSKALAQVQKATKVKVSLTLPVLPNGLTSDGLNVVKSAKKAGVALDLVNVMAMDYYQSGDYGKFAQQAADATYSQVKAVYGASVSYRTIGVTPMIGKNDDGRVFSQSAAKSLVGYAKSKHLGALSFWETTRDRNACNGALYQCTNVPQKPYEFSKIFAGFTG
jgi:hypothetical protein